MTTTLTVTGPTFTNKIMPPLPAIPALKSLAFFGNAVDDSNSGNRVPDGPAFSVVSGAPAYASNYVNLSLQASGARHDGIDTNVLRDASALAAGCTWAAVVRCANLAGANISGMVWGDFKTGLGTQYWGVTIGGFAPGRINLVPAGANRGFLQLTSSILSNWHFVAMTYSGGGAGTFILYDFTENPTTGVPFSWATTGVTWTTGNESMHFGSNGESQSLAPVEHAFGLGTLSVLSAATLSQVAAWARWNLARRGIVC